MRHLSGEEVAHRAGVGGGRLRELVDLGIIAARDGRFTDGDVRRVTLVQALEDSGVELRGLAELLERGDLSLDFVDMEAYERFSALSALTFQELSDRTGVPVDLLMVVREASGAARPTPHDHVRDGELAVVPMVQMAVGENGRPDAVERLLRAMGEGLRRIAASEADYWRDEVLAPRLAAGMSMDAVVDPEFTNRFGTLTDEALLALYHAQQAQAWTRNILDGFEQALVAAGLHTRLDSPPAMCFLDITGYTRLTQERGDTAAADLAQRLGRVVERTSAQHGGRPVKWLGDGVMLWFGHPGPAVDSALDMRDNVATEGLPPAHVGLHAGPVVFQDGDYYGQTVNIAARIADYARPGEVVVSQAVVEASSGTHAAFTELGQTDLRGVGGQVTLHAAHRRPQEQA
jgi:adenylate cyclase